MDILGVEYYDRTYSQGGVELSLGQLHEIHCHRVEAKQRVQLRAMPLQQ